MNNQQQGQTNNTQDSDGGVVPETLSANGGWQKYFTPDGKAYYFNKITKSSQWTKPDAFGEGEEEEQITPD